MKKLQILLCGAMVLFFGVGSTLAQDPAGMETANQELKDSDIQWVLGEVVNIDLKNNLIVVKYLDYEDNQEKEMSISVDAATTYESIKSLGEIKLQDFLSIDYAVAADGKNLAKNIGLDKAKESQTVETPMAPLETPVVLAPAPVVPVETSATQVEAPVTQAGTPSVEQTAEVVSPAETENQAPEAVQ